MASAFQYRRLLAFATLLVAGFTGIACRLYYLQIERHRVSREEVSDATTGWRYHALRRADILDARGNPLATSTFVKTVCADPSLIGTNQARVARAIAPVLELSEAELIEKMALRTWVDSNGLVRVDQHVILKRKVPEEVWERARQAMSKLSFDIEERDLPRSQQQFYARLRERAVFADPVEDQLRTYPNGALAAHILGYVASEERGSGRHRVIDVNGVAGVEQRCDSALRGARGWRQMVTDHRRRELVAMREEDVPSRPGLNVVLTLDAGLQDIVEWELAAAVQKHAPTCAMAVVVQPATGRILALANWPTFDPNRPWGSAGSLEALRNRVVTDVAEPGSTFKIVVVSAALNEGLVTLEDRIFCENGSFAFLGRVLGDDHRYGTLTVEEIVAKSSNIGAAKLGLKLGPERLYDYIRRFGFGEPTGVTLPGEVAGILRPPERWTKISPAWIPMGHEVAVTSLQMVMAMAAIANQGVLMRPWLIERLVDENGRTVVQHEPEPVRRVVTEATARLMTRALVSVVSTNGTGANARLEHYAVAGKTGTAQKLVGGRYSRSHHYSSFVGFFPAESPELCVLVALDEPKNGMYGGATAAPVFRRIAERAAGYLSIRPSALAGPPQSRPGPEAGRARGAAPKPGVVQAAGMVPR